jgi:hypothetical protein
MTRQGTKLTYTIEGETIVKEFYEPENGQKAYDFFMNEVRPQNPSYHVFVPCFKEDEQE